jgi:hypothetical protein
MAATAWEERRMKLYQSVGDTQSTSSGFYLDCLGIFGVYFVVVVVWYFMSDE